MSEEVKTFITETITKYPVVLFMKGTAQFPQCGFSAKAIELLREAGVRKLVTINVLEDQEIRTVIKEYSSWPTIPQLYVEGKFVGGTDILTELANSGELKNILEAAGALDE